MNKALAFIVLLFAGLTAIHAAPTVTAPQTVLLRPNTVALLSPTLRLSEFNKLQEVKKVPSASRSANLERFKQLPVDLQERLLAAGGSEIAVSQVGVHSKYLVPVDLIRINPELLKTRIKTIWPVAGQAPGEYAFAQGSSLNATTQIKFNGAATESVWVDFGWIMPASVAFRVPAGTARGTSHSITAQTGALTTEPFTYKVVAPRKYRGYDGWQFANFSDTTIPWAMYKDFFGASAVEYGDGTHRPAAQAWYDSAYKGVGNGGNCYGMSVSSLRHRVTGGISTFWTSWFANAANHQSSVWFYPWRTETKQSVQEDQGGQLSAEMAAVINNYYNNQSHQAMFNRVNANLGTKLTVLGMWGSGGHAIVPYGTNVVGNDRQLLCYDNNNPYAENEGGAVDPNVAHVNWSANSFSYGGYSKAIAMSYDECLATPHLPASATGSAMGSVVNDTVVAVLSPGARPSQITDENGRRFFSPDGSLNRDPNTRIPNSSRFVPLTGSAPGPNDPLIYVFGAAQNKSLSFTLAGRTPRTVSLFQQGTVLQADVAGEGVLRFTDVLRPSRGLLLENPAQLRPTRLQVIHAAVAGDRSFELVNLTNVGGQSLRLLPAAGGASLEVQSAVATQFDLRLSGPQGRGAALNTFTGLVTNAASRAVFQPLNWQDLRSSALNFELRSLQGNQLQNSRRIQPR